MHEVSEAKLIETFAPKERQKRLWGRIIIAQAQIKTTSFHTLGGKKKFTKTETGIDESLV